MNDMSVILERISEDAKVQAAGIIETAKKNCESIKAEYNKEAEQQKKAILSAAAAQAEAIRLRAASQSGIEQRNLKLETRRAAIDAAFEKAMETLCAMSDEKKVALYSEMAAQSVSGDAAVILNAAEKASIGEAVIKMASKKLVSERKVNKLYIATEVGKFRGGIKLREGNIETNCTFEVLIAQAKEEMEPEVAKILFQ
ncbi:MAG: V-type ATP synthase subunit E [Angelakisella sp.]